MGQNFIRTITINLGSSLSSQDIYVVPENHHFICFYKQAIGSGEVVFSDDFGTNSIVAAGNTEIIKELYAGGTTISATQSNANTTVRLVGILYDANMAPIEADESGSGSGSASASASESSSQTPSGNSVRVNTSRTEVNGVYVWDETENAFLFTNGGTTYKLNYYEPGHMWAVRGDDPYFTIDNLEFTGDVSEIYGTNTWTNMFSFMPEDVTIAPAGSGESSNSSGSESTPEQSTSESGEYADSYNVVDTYYESLGGTYTKVSGRTQNGAPVYYNSVEDTYLALCNYMETYYAWAFTSSNPVAETTSTDIMFLGTTAYKNVGNGVDFPTGLGPDAYPEESWYDGSQGTDIDPAQGEITVTAVGESSTSTSESASGSPTPPVVSSSIIFHMEPKNGSYNYYNRNIALTLTNPAATGKSRVWTGTVYNSTFDSDETITLHWATGPYGEAWYLDGFTNPMGTETTWLDNSSTDDPFTFDTTTATWQIDDPDMGNVTELNVTSTANSFPASYVVTGAGMSGANGTYVRRDYMLNQIACWTPSYQNTTNTDWWIHPRTDGTANHAMFIDYGSMMVADPVFPYTTTTGMTGTWVADNENFVAGNAPTVTTGQ